MKLIQELSDMIEEEISDAHKYAKCSLSQKESDPELAKTFAQLSSEELGHADKLHTQVVRLIKEYRESHGDPPEHMLFIYNYLHDRHIQKVAEIKAMLA